MSLKSNHIAVFSLAYAPHEAGAEIAIRKIMERIPSFNFTVFTKKFDTLHQSNSHNRNIEIVRVGFERGVVSKILYIIHAWRAAEAIHKKEPFKAVWGVMAAYAGGAALLFKLRHPNIPLLLTLQEGDSESYILRRVFLLYPLWRLLFKKADHIQVISSYLANFAKRHGAVCPISIIPNGVDLENFKTKSIKSKPLNSKELVIITTSRLVYKNGIDTLIRAFALLNKNSSLVTDNKLIIVGDGPLRKKLETLAIHLGINDKVVFMGQVDEKKIAELLSEADIFVRPSRSEGLGNSFLEAMAIGLPIIGTPVGGILDFLKDGETGLIINVDDAYDLSKKIENLSTNIRLREHLIKNGIKLVHDRYSWTHVVKDVQSILDGIHVQQCIVIASGIVPPEIGGPAYYAEKIKKAFQEKGHRPSIVSYGLLKYLPTGFRHIAYGGKILLSVLFSRPSSLIVLDTFSVGFPAVFVGKLMRVPTIIRTGGDFLWELYVERTGKKILFSDFYTKSKHLSLKERMIFVITRMTLRYADIVVFSTIYQRDIFIQAYELDRSRTAVIENYYPPISVSKNPTQKNFICFTRQLKWKNIDTLERAFSRAKRNAFNIILETGTLPREKYLEKLKDCYAVILVSLGDISPNMILEAMAYGKPFILTTENGLESRLQGIGLRAHPLDEVEIASAILSLTEDDIYKKEKQKLSEFSFQHSYEEIAQEFLDLYTRL